jgi:sugar-specific transcriptional regulator TrmB
MANPVTDLSELLRTLGFSQNEARAYEALLGLSGATAYEVSQHSGLPRANTYTILKSLDRKGAVQQVTADPVRYEAVSPREFFGHLARQTSDAAEQASILAESITRPEDPLHAWTYRGASDVRAKLVEMISSAREHVWIKGPVNLILPHADDLKEAAARGVSIILISLGEGQDLLPKNKNIQVMPHEGTGSVIGATSVLLTVTCDCENCMIATFSHQITATFARNQSIVYVIETLILHEIFLAEIYASMGEELEARFGVSLAKLRKRYRPQGMERRLLGAGRRVSPQ